MKTRPSLSFLKNVQNEESNVKPSLDLFEIVQAANQLGIWMHSVSTTRLTRTCTTRMRGKQFEPDVYLIAYFELVDED